MDDLQSSIKTIDLHIHTQFSDGICSVEEVSKIVEVKHLSLIAIADHYSELVRLPKRMSKYHLSRYLDTLENFNLLKGVEVEILNDGTVSISRTSSDLFDVILGGLHIIKGIRLWGDYSPILNKPDYVEAIRVALIKAMESGLIEVIAHVTRLPETLLSESNRLITYDWIDSVVDAASDYGIAVELSGAWKIPDERFVTECLKQGVKLSLGSDAHSLQMVGDTRYGVELMKQLEIDKDSIFLPKKTS